MARGARISRRDLIKLGVFGSAALMLPAERVARTAVAQANRIPESRLPRPFTLPFATPPVLTPVRSSATTDYFELTQMQAPVEILPGLKTDIFSYNGVTPGPTIVVERGRPAVVRHKNMLPGHHPTLRYEPYTSTHLHGSASLPQYDGYANDVTHPGEYKDYHYPNSQDARTLWYHDHGVGITAENAYMGLAAMYVMHDDLERSLPIPHGRYDVPIIIKDALFESSGALIFDDHGESGLFGDVVLVNGVPWPAMKVERRKYRFRLLNASVSRSYELALDSGEPLTVIASEGGLFAAPQPMAKLKQGMAERYEVIVDFAKYKVGQRVVLKNLGPPNNIDFANTGNVMAFDVVGEATDTSSNSIPEVLNPGTAVMALQESDAKARRLLDFKRHNGQWEVSGRNWDDVINSGFTEVLGNPALGDVELWELRNNSNGWFHPIHVHLVDFKVLDRNCRPPRPNELGGKDVVYLGEGETVRVLMRFAPNPGKYMIHCHNLVHEDHDMMTQYEVGSGGDDPIHAAPAQPLPAPPL